MFFEDRLFSVAALIFLEDRSLNEDLMLSRARARLDAGDRGGAAAAYADVLKSIPACTEALLELARLHLDSGRHRIGRDLILRALATELRRPRDVVLLARELAAVGESRLLRELAMQLPVEAWDSASNLTEFSRYLASCGLHEHADQCLARALAIDPSHPPANYAMAAQDIAFGRFSDAERHVSRCLDVLPDDPGAHWLRSRLALPDPGARIERLKSLLASSVEPASRAWFGYALHNELHEAARYDEAWAALQVAAASQRSLLRYDVNANRAIFSALSGVGAEECRKEDGHHDTSLTPVFVVGHYRSGTTLLERLLSGHPSIAAGGESYDFPTTLRRECGLHFKGECHEHAVMSRSGFDYARMGRSYLDAMRWRARGRSFVTDKLPGNVLNLGAIARALPAARFAYIRRDVLEVGLSMYRTLFGDACPYSYDINEFAEYHRRHEALVAHWRKVLPPGRMVEIDYAALVADPQSELMPLLDCLGLGFDHAMLDLKRQGDAVATASSVVVRGGLRTDRNRFVSSYGPWLGPMADALGVPRPLSRP